MAVPLHNNSIPSYTSAVHFYACPLLLISAHSLCFALRLYSMPLRLLTVLFQYEAVLSYSAAFRSHSLAHLLRAAPFLRISMLFYCQSSPYCSCAYPLCTFPQQFHSVLLSACAFPDLALPFHFFATLGNSIPLPNLTFPLQCISFLFHRLSRLINAVTDQCVAFPLHCISIPQPCDSNQCRYLKIVVGLWLISCQTKAPLPELRHCPRPLNRP